MISNIFKLKRKKELNTIVRIFSVFYLVLLSGCLNYIQDVNIYPDGSGKMSLHYWSNLPYDIDSEQLKNITFFNTEFLKKEYSSKYYNLKKRAFKERYPGYVHTQTNENSSVSVSMREFVFQKVNKEGVSTAKDNSKKDNKGRIYLNSFAQNLQALASSEKACTVLSETFYENPRSYYSCSTDYDSSDYEEKTE